MWDWMGVVFDLYVFVQHLYQTATGIKAHWPERLGEGVGGGVKTRTCKQAEVGDFKVSMHIWSIELK